MQKNTHFFSSTEHVRRDDVLQKIGNRGRDAMNLAGLKLPILPGFIFDADVTSGLAEADLKAHLKRSLKKLEGSVGKTFGDPENPMLVKIVISPNLAIVTYPVLHDYGLSAGTIDGFAKFVGQNFAHHEVLFLLKGNLAIEATIAELEGRTKDKEKLEAAGDDLASVLHKDLPAKESQKYIDKYLPLLPNGFFDDAYSQLEISIQRIARMLAMEPEPSETALLIQPMVYGNYGPDSAYGTFFTRDIQTGEDVLQGEFYQGKFDSIGSAGKDILKIQPAYLKKLQTIGRTVEDHFREIRSLRFTVENKKLWLIDQRPVISKSAQADIRILLDFHKRKLINDKYLLENVKANQVAEILHPVVDRNSIRGLKKLTGGIAGAPGAAIGRVFFTTEGLLAEYKQAQQTGQDTRLILCMAATYAEDVKAIEVATGVLSSEGGYAAHASVVARQYGKISLVRNDMRFRGKKATLGDVTLSEGDYITLDVPNHGDCNIYLGEASTIEPNPEQSGLLDFLQIVKKYVKEFHVRVNADKPRDAELAKSFGAEGIGLCRTEHMFFEDDRINLFRQMIFADDFEERRKTLAKLQKVQTLDFYKLLKIMAGNPVTIRLLDAPLHEFMPHTAGELESFVKYLNKGKKKNLVSRRDIQAQIEALHEFNPMLGHRGCRIAVSYPEIYEMQVSAIFEAVFKLQKEGTKTEPEIMIPLIMNENELKLIVYGKRIEGKSIRGLAEIAEGVQKAMKAKTVKFKIGTMIELPVAALGAGDIAKYAEFFSFGTNDLTQTTTGLSRDDFNSFMPDYTQFDLLDNNPFQVLNEHVKELVAVAVSRGRMTRPGIKTGLCGEHGAVPENIEFCIDAGLNYVSCSVYSVPIANLVIAQHNLAEES
jgi:pyruvate,orthophosphate dikinase